MKITYASVVVRIGKPYNHLIMQTFKVKEGSSYIKQGMCLGKILLMNFIEKTIKHPTNKDYKKIENISTIQIKRFTV